MTEIKDAVRAAYRERAIAVTTGEDSCCAKDAGFDLYESLDTDGVPDTAVMASMGCGNPTAIAGLQPGERVLDLGSGGGLDVFLSARAVGPDGFATGLDMTDEMIDLAERNRERAGITNASFVKGEIEDIPLADDSVDVVISNCVINLSDDKPAVFREAYRVLVPGGRFAVTDIVATRPFTAEEQADLASWTGCIAGALTLDGFTSGLEQVGFHDIAVEITHSVAPDAVSAGITAVA
jgi:ubiquinone/menaquinone biosynthesis C-methylase UbiE